MTSWRNALRHWSFVPLAVAAVLGLWLAADGRLHWDQPSTLYAAAYQSFDQIVAGDVQPSGIPEFFQGRILHVLILKCLLAVTGPGMAGIGFLVGIYSVLILGFLLIVNRILQGLLPTVDSKSSAVVLLAVTPVMLYLALKPIADVESLAAAALVTLALLRCGQGQMTMAWSVAAAIGLAVVALTKNQMAFMPVGFWASACLVPIGGIQRRRLAWIGVVAGLAGLALTIVVLEILDVGIARYLGSYTDVLHRQDPFAAQMLNFATLLGPLWLLVPMAAFSHRRRELGFLLLWAMLSLTPLLVVASQFEARHLAVVLIAVAGLFGLALEAIPAWFHAWELSSHGRKIAISTLAVLVVMAGNAVTLAVMPHEFEIRQMRTLLNGLDQRYGHGRYVVLTPWPYTDFHGIRVLMAGYRRAQRGHVGNLGSRAGCIPTAAVTRRLVRRTIHRFGGGIGCDRPADDLRWFRGHLFG